jgi:hypothetical protein
MRELVQVFYEPGEVFDIVRERGKWIPAFVAVILVGAILYLGVVELIGAGNIARNTFANSPRLAAMVPAEAVEKAAVDADTPARKAIGVASAAVGQAITLLCLSGLFLGVMSIMDKRVSFARMVGAVSYAWFPVTLVGGLLMLLTIALSSDRASLDPQNLLATNVSLFMSDATSRPLRALAGSFDLLSLARITLLSIAISKVAQIPFRHALGVVLGLWVLWILIRVALSFVF